MFSAPLGTCVSGPPAQELPDYYNAQFDGEAERLLDASRGAADQSGEAAESQSVRLLTRPGHRRRASDLIGGDHLSPGELRARLAHAFVFAPSLPAELHAQATGNNETKRDYASRKLRLGHPVQDCRALPCEACRQGEPCDTNRVVLTMENGQLPVDHVYAHASVGAMKQTRMFGSDALPQSEPLSFVVYGNTSLTSRVPAPYFSWHDFGVMRPAQKVRVRSAGAFISNCAFAKRNDMLRGLRRLLGPRVHSYGRCFNTDNELRPRGEQSRLQHLEQHKFVPAQSRVCGRAGTRPAALTSAGRGGAGRGGSRLWRLKTPRPGIT
jgi:hypothetical protein